MNYDEIDLNSFRLFYLVCKYKSFSKTARALGITQPSVSYNIINLENKLGVKLFYRTGYQLTLTHEGESLFPYVEEALNSFKNGSVKMSDLLHCKIGDISIGVPSHIGAFLLSNILKAFYSQYPNVKVKVNSKPTKELFKMLNNNELDLIIDSSPLEDNIFSFSVKKISSEKCFFACHNSNNELLNKKINISDILNYPMIVPLLSSGSTKSLKEVLEKQDLYFNPQFEIATSDMIAEMIRKKIGIGFLFEKTIFNYNDLCKIDIGQDLPAFDIFIINKEPILSLSANIFVSFVIKNISKWV